MKETFLYLGLSSVLAVSAFFTVWHLGSSDKPLTLMRLLPFLEEKASEETPTGEAQQAEPQKITSLAQVSKKASSAQARKNTSSSAERELTVPEISRAIRSDPYRKYIDVSKRFKNVTYGITFQSQHGVEVLVKNDGEHLLYLIGVFINGVRAKIDNHNVEPGQTRYCVVVDPVVAKAKTLSFEALATGVDAPERAVMEVAMR